MTSARDLHRKAMDLVHKSILAKDNGQLDSYLDLTMQALELEAAAANLLFSKTEAEPTRSVLFRGAATLAFNCGKMAEAEKFIYSALAGNPPVEIEDELRDLLSKIDLAISDKETFDPVQFTLLNVLREKGINLKLQPKNQFYGEHVLQAKDILTFFESIKSAFANFTRINFLRHFPIESFKDYDKVLSSVVSHANILFVDLRFRSFGATISSDTLMDAENFSYQINEWRKKIFQDFKNDLFDINYSDDNDIKYLTDKYNDSERSKIYGGFLSTLHTNANYTVSITENDFQTIKKTLGVVNKETRSKLVQKTNDVEPSKKILIETIAFVPESGAGNIPKSSILSKKQLLTCSWNIEFSEIKYEQKHLILNEPIIANLSYEAETFTLTYPILNISAYASNPTEVEIAFQKEFIRLYIRYVIDGGDFSNADLVNGDILLSLVFSRNW